MAAPSAVAKPSAVAGPATRPILRPGFGTLGDIIKLRSNHFPVVYPTKGYFYRYDVEITVEKKAMEVGKGDAKAKKPAKAKEGEAPRISKPVKRKIWALFVKVNLQSLFGNSMPVFDGEKILYTAKEAKITSADGYTATLVIPRDPDGSEITATVTVKPCIPCAVSWALLQESMKDYTKKFPLEVFGCLNTVFREAAMATATNIAAGRSIYFRDPNYTFDLGWGRETWPGIYSSARPCQWGVTLNLDVANTAFYKKQNVVDFLAHFLQGKLPRDGRYGPPPNQINDAQRRSFDNEIKTLKVEMRHGPSGVRRQRITGVSANTAARHTFENKGKNITVADYFKTEYKMTLKYPNLPLLQIGNGKTMMPMEVCELMSQKVPRKLNEDQTAIMVKRCAQPAPDREKRINVLRKDPSKVDYDKNSFLDAFGIKVDPNMATFDGRVLAPPTITAAGPRGDVPLQVKKMDGTWEARNVMFKEAMPLKNWALISFCDERMMADDAPIGLFIKDFIDVGRQRGMVIAKPSIAPRPSNQPDFVKMMQQEKAKNKDLQLIMVILPRRSPQYAEVKKAGDVAVGIVTQVVLGQKIEDHCNKGQNAMQQYVGNVLLKVNVKLGGTNSEVKEIKDHALLKKFSDKPTIIFGADVTHPSPGEKSKPSVAAVVASHNRSFTKYSARVRAQGARQEIMDTLKDMIKDLLIEFKKRNAQREPQRIIFYRDGVSEGQYFQVMVEELSAIQKACTELAENYKPPITYIVVGKRHNTRLFTVNPRDAVGKAGNVPPGTTTDKAICHYLEFDWFTCSHFGIQGTSRPAHYNVLYDDSKYTADEIQLFSYYLTYVYARCNRSVSIPTPVYYAHHVAFRARAHLEEAYGGDSVTVVSGSSGPQLDVETLNRRIKVHESITGMYFA